MKVFRIVAALLVLLCLLPACSMFRSPLPVAGVVAGQPVATTVDTALARYYIEHYLPGHRTRPAWDTLLDSLTASLGVGVPTKEQLKTIAHDYSTDLATLLLVHRLWNDPANQDIQALFATALSEVKSLAHTGRLSTLNISQDYLMVFAPGWFYQSDPTSGADFAQPRRIVAQLGLQTYLLPTEENGSVERNAAIIAEHLRRLSAEHTRMVLVSASKAGPEVAYALAMLETAEQVHNVKAWVNIGGVLRGSALADAAVRWPQRWYVSLFILRGDSFAGVQSLTTARSAKRLAGARLPERVLIVNYVGIPLSGQVSERARPGYVRLRKEGPNDGLTPIVDEILLGSVTIVELGLDHFYWHPEMPLRTVAMAQAVIQWVERHRDRKRIGRHVSPHLTGASDAPELSGRTPAASLRRVPETSPGTQ